MKVTFSTIRVSQDFRDAQGNLWFRVMTWYDSFGQYNAERVSDGAKAFFASEELVEAV